jgi:uncharacterized membrane-anchored protein YhcB (DUF1043 family)
MTYVIGLIGILVAGVVGWIAYRLRQERARGKAEAKAEADAQALKDATEAKRIESEVEGLTEDELDAQIRRDSADRGRIRS